MPENNQPSQAVANQNTHGEAGISSLPEKEFLYHDDLDYLEDIRLLLHEGRRGRMTPHGLPIENPEFRIHWDQIQDKKATTRCKAKGLRIDNLVIEFELDELQELILCGMAVEHLTGDWASLDMEEFLKAISGEELRGMINARNALDELKKKRLIGSHYHRNGNPALDGDILKYLAEGKPINADKFKEEKKSKPDPINVIAGLAAKFPEPRSIYEMLEKHVVGQEEAKRTLSVAAFMHLQRIKNPNGEGEGIKPNVMLIGPTGCGKTHLVKSLAGILGLPYAIGDSTSWTEAGYVGSDYDEVLWDLYENAGRDIKFAQCGIVFVDEVDKIAAKADAAYDRDIGGEGVQRAMLKALEGSTVTMSKRGEHTYMSPKKEIDTRNIFFVLGGSFGGIEKMIESRKRGRNIGFGQGACNDEEGSAAITTEDLIAYGMLREFVGRIPIVTRVEPLTRNELIEILIRPDKGLIAEINRTCEPCGLRFVFADRAVAEIAEKAIKEGTGARSLRGFVNKLVEPYIYQYSVVQPSKIRVVRIEDPSR